MTNGTENAPARWEAKNAPQADDSFESQAITLTESEAISLTESITAQWGMIR